MATLVCVSCKNSSLKTICIFKVFFSGVFFLTRLFANDDYCRLRIRLLSTTKNSSIEFGKNPVIGIDFGASSCRIAVADPGTLHAALSPFNNQCFLKNIVTIFNIFCNFILLPQHEFLLLLADQANGSAHMHGPFLHQTPILKNENNLKCFIFKVSLYQFEFLLGFFVDQTDWQQTHAYILKTFFSSLKLPAFPFSGTLTAKLLEGAHGERSLPLAVTYLRDGTVLVGAPALRQVCPFASNIHHIYSM